MLNFNSIPDILRFARTKEISSYQFYSNLAETVVQQDTKTMFASLAAEEEHHREAVELELFKLGQTVGDETESAAQPPEDEFDFDTTHLSVIDALKLAIKKEKSSFELYAQLMTIAENEDARKIFYELAEEEMRHLLRVEAQYQSLAPYYKEE